MFLVISDVHGIVLAGYGWNTMGHHVRGNSAGNENLRSIYQLSWHSFDSIHINLDKNRRNLLHLCKHLRCYCFIRGAACTGNQRTNSRRDTGFDEFGFMVII
ncbi:hypothetical protein B296_00053380 [Ensete ventricosum]|uniref:Uncharacterized protein n=1 Tax=Ensete ventricosum TaxID=4639 RepID=A0A426Y8H7_ENSVE|nr:hypothetical protein B296_00053380 [Ensete ventricosum]